MSIVNLRESLLQMDRDTDCKYDLTTLYEACNLDEKKKKQLVQFVDNYDIEATNNLLSNEASSQGLMETVEDDLSDDELKDLGIDDIKVEVEESYNLDEDYDEDFITDEDILLEYDGSSENITIPENVAIIGQYAFDNCSKIKTVIMHDNITSINHAAFSNCISLEKIKLSKNVKFIESFTFSNCTSLTKITIPNSVIRIDVQAFNNCKSLETVIIEGTPEINTRAFEGCNNLSKESKQKIETLIKNPRMNEDSDLDEGALAAAGMTALASAASGFGQAIGDKVGSKLLGEELNLDDIKSEIVDAVKQVMMSPEFGFLEDEVDEYSVVKVSDADDRIKVEVRAEVNYDDLMELCNELDKIISKYDKDAYFEPVDPGIIEAYIFKNQPNKKKDYFESMNEPTTDNYDKHTTYRYQGTKYSVHYTQVNTDPSADPLQMFKEFKATVSEIHPYDDAEYTWAKIENGTIEYIKNGKVIDKSYYMTADDWDLENNEWCDAVIDEAAENLTKLNKEIEPKIMHESKSYGGAYDIEDDQYFTNEELVEYCEEVVETLQSNGYDVKITDAYISPNKSGYIIGIEVEGEDNQAQSTINIDIRKIRTTEDLKKKYVQPMIDKLTNSLKGYTNEELSSNQKQDQEEDAKYNTKNNIKEDMWDYESDFSDGEVEAGDTFDYEGVEYEWIQQYGDTAHLDFDAWAIWEASPVDMDDDNPETKFFIVDVDTGFIDWDCDSLREAQEFLDSKIDDYNSDDDEVEHYDITEDVEDDDSNELNQNSWVVVNIEPKLNNYVSLVPIKVDTVHKRDPFFTGWAWGERIHEYSQSSILYKADSEEDAMKFIENHKGIKVSELKDLKNNISSLQESDDIEDDELNTPDQEFDSANTSINSSKLPSVYRMIDIPKGTIGVDFGGGRFDNAVEHIKDLGATLCVYDPYNRSAEHNREVIKTLRSNGGADWAINSNVLNVIKEPEARKAVLENISKITKSGAPIYITVYEGRGDNKEGPTKSGYQLNRKTADYLEDIQEVFPDATRKGKLIIAHNNSKSVSEDMQTKLSTNSKGDYLVRASSGKGYTVFNKDDTCIGGFDGENDQEAKNKFMSGKITEDMEGKFSNKFYKLADKYSDCELYPLVKDLIRYTKEEDLKDLYYDKGYNKQEDSDDIDESINTPNSKSQIEEEIKKITNNFTIKEDTIQCGFKEECDSAVNLLKENYTKVKSQKVGDWFRINFSK